MSRIAGITFERDARGKAKKIIIDLQKHGEALEDFLDGLIVKRRKGEPTESAASFFERMDKTYFAKRKKK